MIVDGTNAVLGRLAVGVVKELKTGEAVDIINAEKIIITGDPKSTTNFYFQRRRKGSRFHGPFFPKTSNGIVLRAVRGMIDYKSKKGKELISRLKVHLGVPKEFEGKPVTTLGKKEVKCKYITIGKLSKSLGGK
ncbi:MAG: 50S ribosomal protein L13 [Candidatus Aenigmatarchaeota archaeon]